MLRDTLKLSPYFNPLPHTRENNIDYTAYRQAAFQSTPSYEGEPCRLGKGTPRKNFNPLPHTRENDFDRDNPQEVYISIHSLIRGRTYKPSIDAVDCLISIHSLIRGRTIIIHKSTANSTNFNPLPHTRENPSEVVEEIKKAQFQSTPSYEGELQNVTMVNAICCEFM